jgi:hypothetical protein
MSRNGLQIYLGLRNGQLSFTYRFLLNLFLDYITKLFQLLLLRNG